MTEYERLKAQKDAILAKEALAAARCSPMWDGLITWLEEQAEMWIRLSQKVKDGRIVEYRKGRAHAYSDAAEMARRGSENTQTQQPPDDGTTR